MEYDVEELKRALWDLWLVFGIDGSMDETLWYKKYGHLIKKISNE